MTEQAHGTVAFTHQDIRRGIADVENVVRMQLDGDFEEIPQRRSDIVTLRHHRRVLVEQLFYGDIVSHLYGNGIDAVVTLVGGIVQLLFRVDLSQGLVFGHHTLVEGDGISHLVVELHEIGVFPVDQPLVKIAIRQSDLRGLTDVTRLK